MSSSKKTQSAWWPIVRNVVLGLAAGAGAGVIATTWTSHELDEYARQLQASQGIPRITTSLPLPVPGTYEEALSRVREKSEKSIAALVVHTEDTTLSKNWRSDSDAVAFGAVVSDDGWIAFDQSAFQNIANPDITHDVWIGWNRYSISKIIEDPSTSLTLVKVDATGLISVNFASTQHVASGAMMFAIGTSTVLPETLQNSEYAVQSGVLPAEEFLAEWELSLPTSVSMPLFNTVGALAGFTRAGESTVLPIHHALRAVREVVRTGAVSLPTLGAYVVDLSHALGIAPSVRQELHAGALVIAPNAVASALVKDGPAAQAGVALGDVILAVDGDSVTSTLSLPEILAAYSVGNTVHLTLYRGGETLTIPVTLGDGATVVY